MLNLLLHLIHSAVTFQNQTAICNLETGDPVYPVKPVCSFLEAPLSLFSCPGLCSRGAPEGLVGVPSLAQALAGVVPLARAAHTESSVEGRAGQGL